MELEMVLNELSLYPLATDVYTARQRMSDFVQTAAAATRHGVKRTIRTHNDLDAEELAPGYPIVRWRNDSGVDRETKSFFNRLRTNYPASSDIADVGIQHNVDLSDCFHGKDQATGLGVAYWLDDLAVSLRSETRWHNSRLKIKILQIDDDEEITDTIEEIVHASSIDHIREHLHWISNRLRQDDQISVADGMAIWENKEDRFPHLYFCDKVGEQLEALSRGHMLLMPIMKRLYELEDFCKSWREGPFDDKKMASKVTNESDITIEMYGIERTFRCHDGKTRIFRWHARLTPGAWRLYFYPLPEQRKLIIGYIGPHLRTMHFPH